MLNIKNRNLIALWAMVLLLTVPFSIASRFPPYLTFYSDVIVCLLISLSFFSLLFNKKINAFVPRGTIYFVALAAYWQLQPLFVSLPYPLQNTRIALLFLLLGALFWSVQSLLLSFGRQTVFRWIAWAVTLGAIYHAMILFLQIIDVAKDVDWFVFYNEGQGSKTSGQFGQRNLLGHYLMWGILSAAYLLGSKVLPKCLGFILILCLGVSLALVDSRAIIAYLFAISLLLLAVRLIFGRAEHQLAKTLFYTIALVLLAQWLVPIVLSSLEVIDMQSGLDRLIDRPDANVRTLEWKKAWHSFLNAPILGNGWDSYAYQSVIADWELVPDTYYHSPGLFTHSHNIFLQILAEMGVIGGLLVVMGLLWVIMPMFKKLNERFTLLVFAILLVTACHSVLEYPLWNINFLAAAVVFLALAQPYENLNKALMIKSSWRLPLLFSSFVVFSSLIFVLLTNQWLITKKINESPSRNINLRFVRVQAMFEMGKNIPFLEFYGDLGKAFNASFLKGSPNDDELAALERINFYFPAYDFSSRYGLVLYNQGEQKKSRAWMKKLWHYSPHRIPQSMKEIYEFSPKFKKLEDDVYQVCLRQKELNLYKGLFESCEKPPYMTPKPKVEK